MNDELMWMIYLGQGKTEWASIEWLNEAKSWLYTCDGIE